MKYAISIWAQLSWCRLLVIQLSSEFLITFCTFLNSWVTIIFVCVHTILWFKFYYFQCHSLVYDRNYLALYRSRRCHFKNEHGLCYFLTKKQLEPWLHWIMTQFWFLHKVIYYDSVCLAMWPIYFVKEKGYKQYTIHELKIFLWHCSSTQD